MMVQPHILPGIETSPNQTQGINPVRLEMNEASTKQYWWCGSWPDWE
jgi:hypothetical protein